MFIEAIAALLVPFGLMGLAIVLEHVERPLRGQLRVQEPAGPP